MALSKYWQLNISVWSATILILETWITYAMHSNTAKGRLTVVHLAGTAAFTVRENIFHLYRCNCLSCNDMRVKQVNTLPRGGVGSSRTLLKFTCGGVTCSFRQTVGGSHVWNGKLWGGHILKSVNGRKFCDPPHPIKKDRSLSKFCTYIYPSL